MSVLFPSDLTFEIKQLLYLSFLRKRKISILANISLTYTLLLKRYRKTRNDQTRWEVKGSQLLM